MSWFTRQLTMASERICSATTTSSAERRVSLNDIFLYAFVFNLPKKTIGRMLHVVGNVTALVIVHAYRVESEKLKGYPSQGFSALCAILNFMCRYRPHGTFIYQQRTRQNRKILLNLTDSRKIFQVFGFLAKTGRKMGESRKREILLPLQRKKGALITWTVEKKCTRRWH